MDVLFLRELHRFDSRAPADLAEQLRRVQIPPAALRVRLDGENSCLVSRVLVFLKI